MERKTEPDDRPVETVSNRTRDDATPAIAPSAPSAARVYSMVGTITDVSCSDVRQIQITVKAQTIVMHLHAGDFSQVAIKSAGANSAAKKPGCAGLRGRSAHVSYQLVPGKAWDGELVSIEFQDTH
jgi:hypothetical protein